MSLSLTLLNECVVNNAETLRTINTVINYRLHTLLSGHVTKLRCANGNENNSSRKFD